MKKEEKQMNIYEILQTLQSELKAPKNLYNKFGQYYYRSAESICESVKPLLAKYGCVLTLTDDIIAVGNRIYIKAVATLTNANNPSETMSVSAMAREDESIKGMSGSQITGASSSYARKYALNGLFCIDDTKDADATNDHGKGEPSNAVNEALREITSAKDMAELVSIWNAHKDLQSNPKFTSAMTARKGELK